MMPVKVVKIGIRRKFKIPSKRAITSAGLKASIIATAAASSSGWGDPSWKKKAMGPSIKPVMNVYESAYIMKSLTGKTESRTRFVGKFILPVLITELILRQAQDDGGEGGIVQTGRLHRR